MFRKNTITTAIAGIATACALAFGGAALAQTAAPAGASDAHAGGWHHHGHGGFEHQLEKLHAQLNLNGQQEALWQTAVNTTRANRQQMRALHTADKTQMQSQMQLPILDLSGMHAAREQQTQQFHQLREQNVQAWLAVYNSLNDQQKTLVSASLKANWAQMHERQAAMKQHWMQQHPGAGASAAQ